MVDNDEYSYSKRPGKQEDIGTSVEGKEKLPDVARVGNSYVQRGKFWIAQSTARVQIDLLPN